MQPRQDGPHPLPRNVPLRKFHARWCIEFSPRHTWLHLKLCYQRAQVWQYLHDWSPALKWRLSNDKTLLQQGLFHWYLHQPETLQVHHLQSLDNQKSLAVAFFHLVAWEGPGQYFEYLVCWDRLRDIRVCFWQQSVEVSHRQFGHYLHLPRLPWHLPYWEHLTRWSPRNWGRGLVPKVPVERRPSLPLREQKWMKTTEKGKFIKTHQNIDA